MQKTNTGSLFPICFRNLKCSDKISNTVKKIVLPWREKYLTERAELLVRLAMFTARNDRTDTRNNDAKPRSRRELSHHRTLRQCLPVHDFPLLENNRDCKSYFPSRFKFLGNGIETSSNSLFGWDTWNTIGSVSVRRGCKHKSCLCEMTTCLSVILCYKDLFLEAFLLFLFSPFLLYG
jgi:hypothetical protein